MLEKTTAIQLKRFIVREFYSNKVCTLKASDKIILANTYYKEGIPGTHPLMYLREEAYKALKEASRRLPENYAFYVFDAYRSKATQIYMYESFKKIIKQQKPHLNHDDLVSETLKFVPHPSMSKDYKTMPHNSGGAIDLCIAHKAIPLDFGSAFDEPSERSATIFYENATNEKDLLFRDRRRYLVALMQDFGFTAHPDEWWHFNMGNESWSKITKKPPIFLSMEGLVARSSL